MYKKERTFILISITILLLISICNFSFAAYPEREVTLLMASSAGGGDDLIAQTFKPYLEKYLGVRTICDYKIGAGMTVAWAYIVNSTKPDGYTLGLTKVPHLAATEIMRKDEKKHKWEDIVPVYNIVVDPNILLVRGDSPINTLEEYIEYCKENPGMVTLSSTGVGGDDWIAAKLLQKATGIDTILVAFESDGFVIQSLIGKHIESSILNVGGVMTQLQDGRLKALAVLSDERCPFVPDIPTTVELGYNVVGGSSRGWSFLKGTPEEIIDTMESAIDQAVHDPEFLEKAKELGINVVPMNREKYTEYWNSSFEDIKGVLIDEIL